MATVTMMEELQAIANCCECEATEKRLNGWIKKASAAPEQEAVAWACAQQLRALNKAPGSATCAVWNASGFSRVPLYTHPNAEIDRLRAENKRLDLALAQADHNYDCDRQQFEQKLAEAQALLARVINSGALSREQYDELEADICAEVDVVAVLKRLEFKEHLAKCAEEVAAMPTYKRECLKSPAALSATAQPAECGHKRGMWNLHGGGHCSDCGAAIGTSAQPAEVKS